MSLINRSLYLLMIFIRYYKYICSVFINFSRIYISYAKNLFRNYKKFFLKISPFFLICNATKQKSKVKTYITFIHTCTKYTNLNCAAIIPMISPMNCCIYCFTCCCYFKVSFCFQNTGSKNVLCPITYM